MGKNEIKRTRHGKAMGTFDCRAPVVLGYNDSSGTARQLPRTVVALDIFIDRNIAGRAQYRFCTLASRFFDGSAPDTHLVARGVLIGSTYKEITL